VPDLIKCLEDPKGLVCSGAIWSLGEIHQEPERVVPALLWVVEQYRTNGWSQDRAEYAAQSLGKFRAEARPAVPVLVELLSCQDGSVRALATNALRQIDPEALGKASAGEK
jgi:HEAT repeat protein